jgi:Skp family chaperone for outer membrane proteins
MADPERPIGTMTPEEKIQSMQKALAAMSEMLQRYYDAMNEELKRQQEVIEGMQKKLEALEDRLPAAPVE